MQSTDSDDKPKLSREQIDQLADDIAEAAAHIDAATHRLLTDIRRFDECGGWYRQGARTCAHWLSYRIGLGVNAAREKVPRGAGCPRITLRAPAGTAAAH